MMLLKAKEIIPFKFNCFLPVYSLQQLQMRMKRWEYIYLETLRLGSFYVLNYEERLRLCPKYILKKKREMDDCREGSYSQETRPHRLNVLTLM